MTNQVSMINIDPQQRRSEDGMVTNEDHPVSDGMTGHRIPSTQVSKTDKSIRLSWFRLLMNYGQETTMHGVRYVTEPNSFLSRRLAWLFIFLLAFALLLWLVIQKIIYLQSNPKNVNLDFNFNATLPFPAVTICNQSPYRITEVDENDLYDFMVIDAQQKNATHGSRDTYWLYKDVCEIPPNISPKLELKSVSRAVCRLACSEIYDKECSGFLYSRQKRKCTLSPYTGERISIEAADCDGFEFYRRSRLLETEEIFCNFEEKCAFEDDFTATEPWTYRAVQSRTKWDNTLNIPGKGNYLEMSKTDEGAGNTARLISPYLNTTKKCLELYYFIRADDDQAAHTRNVTRLSIVVVSEQLEETTVASVSRSTVDFIRMFTRLPAGVHRLVVEGQRDSSKVACSLSIDDVAVMDCTRFDAEAECLTNPGGRGYLGKVQHSSSGRKCEHWSKTPDSLGIKLQDRNIEDAQNYCMYIPGSNWAHPSCLVSTSSGRMRIEPCNIEYCGAALSVCRENASRKCHNGMCLPKNLECDDVEYCSDGSTTDVLCREFLNVSCDFEYSFICGYTKTTIDTFSWQRMEASGLRYMQSGRGYIMAAKSNGRYGDQVTLTSTIHNYSEPTILKFSYYIQQVNTSIEGTLLVYLLSKHRAPVKKLFSSESQPSNEWQEQELCIPAGTYYVQFVARLGLPFKSDIGLDDIQLTDRRCTVQDTVSDTESLQNCKLNGSWCGGTTTVSSTSVTTSWAIRLVPATAPDSLTTVPPGNQQGQVPCVGCLVAPPCVGCEGEEDIINPDTFPFANASDCGLLEYNATEGVIASPRYPDLYPNYLKCGYNIGAPESSSITITFDVLDIEFHQNCGFDFISIMCSGINETKIKFCGNVPPAEKTFNCSILTLTFFADAYVQAKGFKLRFTVNQPPAGYTNNVVNLALQIQQTGLHLDEERKIDIFFPPVRLDSYQSACLEMNLAALVYFEVKLVYATPANNDYKERLMFRSIESLGKELRLWKTTITPDMTEGHEFVVVLHSKSSSLGTMAIIDNIKLHMSVCNAAGEEKSIVLGQWRSITSEQTGRTVRRYEAHTVDSDDACFTFPITVKPNEDFVVSYDITSDEILVRMNLRSPANNNIIRSRLLPTRFTQFYQNGKNLTEPYDIEFCASSEMMRDNGDVSTPASAVISAVYYVGNSSEPEDVGINCSFSSSFACGYTWGDQWIYIYDYLVHVSKGFKDVDSNQLVTPEFTVSKTGNHLMLYFLYIRDFSLNVYILNELYHRLPDRLYYKEMVSGVSDTTECIGLPVGTYRLGIVLLSDDTSSEQVLYSVEMSSDADSDYGCVSHETRNTTFDTRIDAFYSYTSLYGWICGSNQSFTYSTKGVYVDVRYETKGIFAPDMLDNSRSYREFTGYVIVGRNCTMDLTINETLRHSIDVVTPMDLENGIFSRHSILCQDGCSFASHSGIFQLIIPQEVLGDDYNNRIHYSIRSEASTLCPDFNVLVAETDAEADVAVPVAEWMSDIRTPLEMTSGSKKACLLFDLYPYKDVFHNVRFEMIYRTVDVETVNKKLLFSVSNDGVTDRVKDVFEFSLDDDISRYQIVAYFYVKSMSAGDIAVKVANLSVEESGCSAIAAAQNRKKLKNSLWNGGTGELVDVSNGSYHWMYRSAGEHVTQFAMQSTGWQHNGTVNVTISGRKCQRWDRQWPHQHRYHHLADQENYCRDPNDNGAPWCFTMDSTQLTEFCLVPMKQDASEHIVVEFGDGRASAVLMSDILVNETTTLTSACLSLQLVISSSDVDVTIAVSTSLENLATSPKVVTIPSCSPRHPCYWQETVLINSGERLFITGRKFRATRGTLTLVSVTNMSLTPGNCSSDSTETTDARTEFVLHSEESAAPMEEYVYLIYKETKDKNMKYWTTRLSQDREHFILECKFAGRRCSTKMLKNISTDMGLCYAFNNDPADRLISSASGANLGLSLTLNVEQYEDLAGHDDEAGLLIAMHEPGDRIIVADKGMAVAPGLHTLFDIKYIDTKSLPSPHGCDDAKTLDFYESQDTYSISKCRLECQAKSLNLSCGCIAPYMPGPFSICNLESEFTCFRSWKENSTDISTHDCPPSCHQITYDATVSGSMLSEMFIQTLLTRSFGPDIRHRYLDALEVHSRVETDSMMEMMRQLDGLVRAHQTLVAVIDVDLLNPATSTVGDIYNAVNNVVQRTHDSVQQFRAHLLKPFTDTYEKKVDFFVRRIVDQANIFLAYHASTENGSFANVDVNNSAVIFCQSFSKFWTWFMKDYHHKFKASTYFDRKMCTPSLLETCENYPVYTERDEKEMPGQIKVWRKCMTQFREFQNDADSWLFSQATLNSSMPLPTVTDDVILAKLRNNTDYLNRTTESFRMQRINKTYLAKTFYTELSPLREAVDNIKADVFNSIYQQLTSLITQYRLKITNTLIELMEYLQRLSLFCQKWSEHCGQVEQFARTLFIWRKPAPKLDRSKELIYQYSKDEVWKTWPTHQPLVDFTLSSAEPLIIDSVDDFFRQLLLPLQRLQERVSKSVRATQIEFEALKDTLVVYNRTIVVGPDFVRRNIMKISLFYGDIKFSTFTQNEAYDVKTLLADVGGYLGLLIGGSCLTVIEVVDLIFYNAVLKCCARR